MRILLALGTLLGGAMFGVSTQAQTSSDIIMLVVDKNNLRAKLQTLPLAGEKPKVIKTFDVAMGKNKGDKVKEGDNKTPEGVYFVDGNIDGKKLPRRYGSLAITLDFPNPVDRHRKVTGTGIWLHGVETDLRVKQSRVTEGCVVFYNSDIRALKEWLPRNGSAVVIAQEMDQVNRPEDLEQLRKSVENWKNSWKTRQIGGYVESYHPDFTFRKMNRDGFRTYKNRVFNKYKKMLVDLTDVRLITHPKYAVTMMNQRFNGDDRYMSYGQKTIYWQKDSDGQWKIISEHFDRTPLRPVAYSEQKILRLAQTDIQTIKGLLRYVPADKLADIREYVFRHVKNKE